MDDLDLEQLKQELHDVSDDNRYDVDEIMREVGADAGPEPEGLEELMKSLGVAVAEKPDVDATQPIAAEEPELSGDMDGLQRATEQTQALAEEQAALAEDAAGAALESDPLEEQDSIFAQLFAQLGEIEQKEEPQPETEPVLELEEEPDLMARLFPASEEDGMPAQEQPPEAPSAPVEQETPIHIRTEALTGTQERSDAPLDGSAAEQEAVSDIADDPDLFSRWSAAPEPPEAQTDETFVETKVREAQTQEEEAAVSMEPEETPEEDAPELMDEEPEKQPEPPQKKAKKSIFARWFGASQQPDGEEQAVEAAEPEGLASHETQLLDALEEHTAQQVDAAPEEQLTQRIDSEPELAEEPQPKGSFLDRMMDVFGLEIVEEEIDEPQAEDAPEQPAEAQPQEAEPQAETQPEADAQLPEEEQPDEQQPVEEQRMEDPAEADFRETLRREEEIDTIEDTPEPPQPRPEDTPVISEEELEEFLSDIEAEEEPEHASFEQLLRDSGVETEQSSKLVLPEEFPDEETTVYVDIPVAKAARAAEERTQPPELFDAAAELEKAQVERELAEPEHDPDWLGLSMEELCREVPPLEELRAEGPVMAHEVIRQKEWIMGRIRSYKEELLRAQQPEQAEETPEEQTEETPEPDVIHAADALQQLQRSEQEDQDDGKPVFHDGPTGKPETEAAGQKETVFEITIDAPERAQEAQSGQQEAEREDKLKQGRSPAQARRKPKTPPRAAWPKEPVPKDLNKASRDCRIQAKKQARRSTVVGILTLIGIYISCAADFSPILLPDALQYASNPSQVLLVLLVLLGASVALAYDVVWDGIQALLHGVPNLSTLVDLALALNLVHCVSCLLFEGEEIPYACIAMLALFTLLRAQVSRSTIRHYNYKVAGSAKQPMGLFYHDGPTPHIVKAPLQNTDRFVEQTLRRGPQHAQETTFTLMAVVIAAVLSIVVWAATGDTGRLIYVLAATVTGACQISLITSMVMARSYSARRMQRSGAAADGGAGVRRLADTQTVVLTDEDLFPAGSIALAKLELRSSLNDSTALAYAAALTEGSSLGSMLAEEVRARYGAPLTAHRIVQDVGGGVRGLVGGLAVMLGDERYMARHGVAVHDVPEHGLVLALDGNVAAVLVIDYQVPAPLFNAMQMLTEKKTTIWLHTRNQQVTPELVEQRYALAKGTVVVPDLETDRALNRPHYTDRDTICGLLMRDGFVPLSACLTSARAEARVSRISRLIGVCAAVLCMLLMTYLCYVFVPEDAHPIRVLIYMVLCFVPIFFLENGVSRE